MGKGKSFNDFTYGVGLEVNATSFKQVKDDLKLNLDNLSKMVKSYGKVLKIDPNADLSKLFEEMRKIQSIVDGINGSDNSFSGFVDKGTLGRIAELENSLQTVSSMSKETKTAMNDLKNSIVQMLEPLKSSGEIKLPGTFNDLFGDAKNKTSEIKNVTQQLKALEAEMQKINQLNQELQLFNGKVDGKESQLGKDASVDEIQAWLDEYESLVAKLKDKSSLGVKELSEVARQTTEVCLKLRNAFSVDSNLDKFSDIDGNFISNIASNMKKAIGVLKENNKELQVQRQSLRDQLKGLNADQAEFNTKRANKLSGGQNLGLVSDVTSQVKVTPKVNASEWATIINNVIRNIESKIIPVKLKPTFSNSSDNLKKEIQGNLAQINHAVNVDLQVNDNIEQFNQKIQNIDASIKNARQQLEKQGNFKIRFEYEEGGKFKDAAYKIINQFKHIDANFYVGNGTKFIQEVVDLREEAKQELSKIPINIAVDNQDSISANIDTLRSQINEKIGNIGVNLTLQNIPQFMAQAAMMRDSVEKYYNNHPIASIVEPGGAEADVKNTTKSVVELSNKAKDAQSTIEKIKNTLKSLSEVGFNSEDFLKLGAFDENLKYIKGSKEKVKQLLQEYEELYSKVYASQDELRATYGANEAGYAAYREDLNILKQMETMLNAVLQSQIQYTQSRLESTEKILAKEMQIVETKKEQSRVDSKDSSGQQATQQLGMSAEEATKKIRSLNGTLTQQKKVLKDLESNKFDASSFAKLGEWDKETNSFKKNSQEITQLINRYKELREARIASGGKTATGEEASIRGKLAAILREQKKHVVEIINKNQTELESVKQISAAYKEMGSSKSKAAKTKVGADSTKHIDELTAKLDKAKATLELLNSKKLDAVGSTGLKDPNKYLASIGSKQSFNDLIKLYNDLIAKKKELENAGKIGSAEYEQYGKIYQDVEKHMGVIYQDQLKYTQSKIQTLETQIAKEKEILQLKTQQTKEDAKQSGSTSNSKANVKTGVASTTVKLDGTTLNSLAKDTTLKAIDGKINSIVSQLGKGVVINGSNISIEASNVSVSGKGATKNINNNSSNTNKDPGDKEVKISTISSYSRQLTVFEEQIKRSGLYTDEFKKKLADLNTQLNSVSVQDDFDTYKFDLDRFKEDFEQLKTYDQLYQNFIKSQTKQIQLNDQISISNGPTAELQEKLKMEEQVSQDLEIQLKQYSSIYTQRARQLAIEEAIKRASQEITTKSAAQSDKDINKQNNELTKLVDSAQKKLNDMQYSMQNSKVPMADAAIAKFKEYERLLTVLKTKQQEIAQNPDLLKDEAYGKSFESLLQQMKKVQTEFETLQKSSENFLSNIKSDKDIKPLGATFDATNLDQLHNAMQEFANQTGVGTAKLIEFNDVSRTATFEIQDGKGQVHQLTVAYDEATNSLGRYTSKTKESTSETQKFLNSLKHSFQNVARYIASFGSVYRVFAMLKQGVQYVKDIDSALTELKKVTDETDASYDKFLQDMSKTASVVGSTVSDLTTMAAEWARLGYSMQEAGKLAESTAILLNVSEFEDATKASEALISTMQAFSYTANESQHVVDILNEVGNNFAVSSDGIATALQDSASALMEGGNNLEQAVALVAAANRVVQDPNSVGSALRTISLRLRGTSVKILEEMGEETEGVIESTSKLQAKIKALSGVDILTNAGDYKDTYTILREIGTVWEKMSDIDQAALLELMAGKNRANTLSAILSNMEDLEGAYESALNAEGSALKENEAYLDSIQGRIDLFNNELQTMWMNFLNTDVVKFVVDLGTSLLGLVDNIGLIETALMGVVAYLTIIKKKDFSKSILGGFIGGKNNQIQLLDGQALEDELVVFNAELAKGAEAFGQYKIKAKDAGNGMDILANKVEQGVIQTKNGKVSAEDYAVALQSQSSAAIKAARAEKMKSIAIGLSVMAISGIISAIQSYVDSIKTLEERYDELQSNISTIESDISSLDSELKSIEEQIDSLSNKNLTIAEAEELRKLKEQSAELEKQKELRESTLATYEKQNEAASLQMFNQLLKETAAGQKKAAESGKAWGKAIGTILDVALVAGGIAVTGLSGGLATAAGTAMIGAGMSGTMSDVVGWTGEKIGSSTKESGDSLIEWYESYEKAIAEAETDAAEAEIKYLSDVSDKNYERWQKKVDAVNTLQEEMYNGLEEMQSYINNLEYNDQTAGIIDGYNDLMTHLDVKSNGGNINSQISSIEALKTEYEELSRGVDEHGNNIALTAEEYARYQAIISQVLGYNAGLTQTFNENGGAIYDATGNLIGYNAVLEETIRLLKEQQKQAVIEAIEGKDGSDSPLWDAYTSAKNSKKEIAKKEQDYSLMPTAINYGNSLLPSTWGSDDAAKIIGEVIGEKQGLFDNPDTLIQEYTEKVAENRDKIITAISAKMQQEGIVEADISKYVNEYTIWLDDAIARYSEVNSEFTSQFKQTLALVPQLSDAYENLSGSQLAFVNEYISSLDISSDLSKQQVSALKENIVNLVDTIGADENLQNKINDLIALDPSKIPVYAYRQQFEKLWNEISTSIPEDQRQALLDQLFPDQSQVDTMIAAVQQELEVGSRGLVHNLNLEDLRIAYKVRAEYDNDYEEYRKIVEEREKLAENVPDEKRYFGNVDEYARHVIVVTDNLIEELKTKKLIPDEWTKENVGEYMTTFGGQDFIDNGDLGGQAILYTPILPNGEILHQDTIDAYIDSITKNSSSEAEVLAADKVGMMIGDQLVSGIINGVTDVDDTLINSILEPVFSNIESSNITEYGDNINKIVTDQIVSALDITDSEAANEVSNMVSDTLTNAFASASPDASLTGIIDEYSMELIASADAIKMSQDQHNFQADIYDKEYEALVNLNTAGLTYEQLQQKIAEHKTEATGPIVQTYSTLADQATQLNEVLAQTSEIVLDNTQVTQEYKDSLIALGVSEEDLEDCFDTTNKLVVTNAKKLNNLVKSTKASAAKNVQLAKTQARLQYSELYQEIRQLVNGQQVTNTATLQHIVALYHEMNAIEKTITRYNVLEAQLLGAANAYEKFAQAQEMDSQTDYITSAEEMVLALGQAFNTAELGTETAQAAIAGLVPESVYADLDTVDEKMAAIHKYLKEGKLAEYFDLEFDDNGAITGAEMKLGNLRKFIEDGLANGTFSGTDWMHFDLSEDITSLEDFAKQMGVTEEVAFAFLETLEDHDIEWLNGDYTSLLDKLLPDNLENNIYKNTSALADLEVKMAIGEITAEEYNKKLYGLSGQLSSGVISQQAYDEELANLNAQLAAGTITTQQYNEAVYGLSGQQEQLAEQARTEAQAWYEKTEKLAEYKKQLEEYHKQLETGKDSDGNVIDAAEVQKQVEETTGHINTLTKELAELEEPTEVTLQLAWDDIQKDMDAIEKEIGDVIEGTHYQFDVEAGEYKVILNESDPNYQKVVQFVNLLNEQHVINTLMGADTPDVVTTLQGINDTLTNIQKLLEAEYHLKVDADGAVTEVTTFQSLWDKIADKNVTLSIVKWVWEKIAGSGDGESGDVEVNGTAHAKGTVRKGKAYKSGDWGLPQSEHNALVGELGAEMVVDPSTGRYYTVGDNGAEMVDLPKGAIIFNHKQTEGLLNNGYITSRGKAYAEGNAHLTIYPNGSSKDQWEGTGYSSWDDPTWDAAEALKEAAKDLSDAADAGSDASNDFKETFDWIEVSLEEINESLALKEAKLENAVYAKDKNKIIDSMIDDNKLLYSNLLAGADEYYSHANKILMDTDKIPAQFRDAARDGTIAITEFAGEAGEEVMNAIQEYRELAQKGADLTQQAEETLTKIADLAKQEFDNLSERYDLKNSVPEAKNAKIEAAMDLAEEQGKPGSSVYYNAMKKNTERSKEFKQAERDKLQAKLDEEVKNGNITKYDGRWYEMVADILAVDEELIQLETDLESYQNAINELHWDNFDTQIERLQNVADETQELIDLLSEKDLFDDAGKWTDEGIASIGLLGQQMENAKLQSKKYANEIDDLTTRYDRGLISESEYAEKLAELKKGQYDSIKAYNDSADAIKDMQKARVEAIKEGIDKEIEAYEKLIEKKKEELDSEKDLHDFRKKSQETTKNIADIERQLAALAGDNSMAAQAKKARLEAELAEARAEQEEMYYERSVTNQQEAYDKELENFTAEKEAEKEGWDEWLENTDKVMADAFSSMTANATVVNETLKGLADEYGLELSEAIIKPWEDGATTMGTYWDSFTTLGSDAITSLKAELESFKTALESARREAQMDVDLQNQQNKETTAATYVEPQKPTKPQKPAQTGGGKGGGNTSNPPKAGATVTVKKSATHFGPQSGSKKMASFVPGGTYTVYETMGTGKNAQVLIGKNGAYTGWVKLTDIQGYAKGTTGVDKDQFAWIDELGEELVLQADGNGRLKYLTKGSSVIPHDITENLMSWGELDPSNMLEQNRPSIGVSPEVHNTEINLDCSVGTLVNIEHCDQGTLPDVEKMVNKAFDKHMQTLNNSIKKFVR